MQLKNRVTAQQYIMSILAFSKVVKYKCNADLLINSEVLESKICCCALPRLVTETATRT